MLRLQRKCDCGGSPGAGGECAECSGNKEELQRSAVGPAPNPAAPPIVHQVLRSSGQPLDRATRAFMEQRFGQDFSRVRLHTGPQAAESAAAVNARAFTVGQDIVFGAGHLDAGTIAARKLLAHELAHTVQQRGAPAPAIARQTDDERPQSNAAEQQANQAENAVTNEVAPGGGGTEPQPVDPSQMPAQPTTGPACPVSAELSSFAVGLGEGKGCKVNCRPASGNSGTGRLAHFRLTGLQGPGNPAIDEQFTPLEENPPGIGALLQPVGNSAVNGLFDDCYCIESRNPLPPDFRLKAEQNHLLNGAILDKNQITFTAEGIRFCHFDRKPGGCDFGARCKL